MTNEQKFKTPEERGNAFRRFCDERICNNECPCYKRKADCRFLWLALEAEEEKPLACPFCGREAEVSQPMLTKGVFVRCRECGAFITAYSTEADAIAAWNRRAK